MSWLLLAPTPAALSLIAVLAAVAAVVLWPKAAGADAWTHGKPTDVDGLGPTDLKDPASSPDPTVTDVADALVLLALVLRSGTGHVEAIDRVAALAPAGVGAHLASVAAALRWGLSPGEAWACAPGVWRPAAQAWALSAAAGAAPAGAIEAAAARIRDAEQRRIHAATERAATLLVLPLGLCFLPAFACSTVIPIVIALVGDAVGGAGGP